MIARLLEREKLNGRRIVIVTNAGGPGALCADYCEESKLEVAQLPGKFIKSLNLPNAWSHNNPIDLVGDARADRYKEVFDKLAKESFYDILICLLTPQEMSEIEKTALELIKFKNKTKKPVIACFMGGYSVEKAKDLLDKKGILCFTELKRAVNTLSLNSSN